VVAPNVAVLRGPAPPVAIQAASLPHEVPSLPAGMLYGLAVLALLWFAGAGWTTVLLGPGYAPETKAIMAPVVGTAVVMLGGFASAELGVRLGLGGALGAYLVVSLSGLAVAALGERRSVRPPPPPTWADPASTRRSA
jgi:hypothetical protein